MVQLTQTNGTITKNYDYDAFGIEKDIDQNDTNPFRYCGEYYDKETETYYLRARYYNPSVGRFITEDSYLGKLEDPLSLNLYTYAYNNPVMYIDPSGHFPYHGRTKDDVIFYPIRRWFRDKFVDNLGPVWGWYEAVSGEEVFTGLKLTDTQREQSAETANENLIDGMIGLACNGDIEVVGMGNYTGAKGLIGHDYEDFLTENIGGNGSFSMGGRDFDGGLSNRWWEAKSGQYWDMLEDDPKMLEKFKSDMGDRLRIAKENDATYELFSNTPISDKVKEWLSKKGIEFTETLD